MCPIVVTAYTEKFGEVRRDDRGQTSYAGEQRRVKPCRLRPRRYVRDSKVIGAILL